MPYDLAGKHVMLNALAGVALRVALHTGDPGAADQAANEVSGGSPAYARKAVTYNSAAAGVVPFSNQPVFDVPGGVTISWISVWNTAGTVRYSKKQVTSETFGSQGTYTITSGSFDLNNDPA